ncbi:MAG: serine hydrolase [Myxococcales bacterium]
MKRLLACVLCCLAVPAFAATISPVEKARFDKDVEDTFAHFHLPGLAVGIIENGEVVYVKTLGEREAGSGEKIDADTLFKIASNTKAMTTGLLARLVDQGKLKWDDPVTKWIPEFKMYDPWVTQNLQVRDLLIHDSGLGAGAGDLMFWPEPNTFTREDIVHGLQYLKPVSQFRAKYAYDNSMYVVAGIVAARAGGKPYAQLVREEIFDQLGMNRCQVGAWNAKQVGNVAVPHMRADGRNVPVREDGDSIPDITSSSAGGIRCSVNDMLKWEKMWLDPDNHWLSDAQRHALWSVQMPMPIAPILRKWDGTHFYGYGYGWRLSDVDGNFKVAHTGTLMGMYSSVILLPDKRDGIVILTNGDGENARVALGETLVKRFTAPNAKVDVAYYAKDLEAPAKSAPAASKAPDTSNCVAATTSDAKDLLGVWRDPWFGEVNVCEANGRIEWRSAKSRLLVGQVMGVGARHLVHWDDKSVDAEAWLDLQDGRMKMSLVDPDADFSYDFHDLDFAKTGECPKPPQVSPATSFAQTDLVDVAKYSPSIVFDMRYAGSDNFVGKPVRGYDAPKCYLLKPAAEALAKVQDDLKKLGYTLHVFDCYRPQRAVTNFVEWAQDLNDTKTKAEHYPNLDKRVLVPDYIAPVSGHSKGATLDVSIDKCDGAHCVPLDFGSGFDLFDPIVNTANPNITAQQKANRRMLLDAMAKRGFVNYDMEWWHFTYKMSPQPDVLYDVPIR